MFFSESLKYDVLKKEKSSHYPVKDNSNESYERNCYSCNCLHWTSDSFLLQNFPNEYCEEIGQGYGHCRHVPVVYVFHIGCLRDSIKTALKECIKTELGRQNQHDCCCKMNVFIEKQGCNSYCYGRE